MKFSGLAAQYYKRIIGIVLTLVTIRTFKAVMMYKIVDGFLLDQYKESYAAYKVLKYQQSTFQTTLKDEEKDDF